MELAHSRSSLWLLEADRVWKWASSIESKSMARAYDLAEKDTDGFWSNACFRVLGCCRLLGFRKECHGSSEDNAEEIHVKML